MFSKSKHGWTGRTGLLGDMALLIAFTAIRSLWLYTNYVVGNDQCTQMNVAMNLLDGRGIVYGCIPDNGTGYLPFNWFPPGTSFMLAFFHYLTGNIFLSEYIIKCLISLAEGALVISIVSQQLGSLKARAIAVILFACYIGHMDRSGVSDMFCAVGGLWLMYLMYRRLTTGAPLDRMTLFALALVMPSMSLVKYNALPITLVPLGMFLCLGVFTRTWHLKKPEWAGIAASSALSVAAFVWSIKFIARNDRMVSAQDAMNADTLWQGWIQRLVHLLRIDPFWLHFGKRVDIAIKGVYGILTGSKSQLIESFHFWQVSSLVLFLTILYFIVRKSAFNRNLVLVLFFFTAAHIAFTSMLTIVKGPEYGKYGIDSVIWTFMEESRLFSHLTAAYVLVLLLGTWRHARPWYWILTAAFAYNTARSIYLSESAMPYLSDTFTKMRTDTDFDVQGEMKKNRMAYYLWDYGLGHNAPGNKTSSGGGAQPAVKPGQ